MAEAKQEKTNTEPRSSLFVRLAMLALTIAATAMWANGLFKWGRQYRITRHDNIVEGYITDIRFLEEQKNFCNYEVGYEYTAGGATLSDTNTIAVSGSKAEHSADQFRKNEQLFRVGERLPLYVHPDDPVQNLPVALRYPARPIISLGLAVGALWLLFFLRLRLARKKAKQE